MARSMGSAEDWTTWRLHILKEMQAVMGQLPGVERLVAPEMKVESEEEIDGLIRSKVTFNVEPGDRIAAYIIALKNLTGKAPAVLCLHQTIPSGKESPAGLSDIPEQHYALELAKRGFVTLAPDYPYFGDSSTDDPYKLGYASGTMKGIWNHMRSIDLLQSLDIVDEQRIGALGHSLGAHNTLFVSAFDERIKAAVSNCGFTSFAKYHGGNLSGWSGDIYMPRIASEYGDDPKKMPFDFSGVLEAIAPRSVLAIAALKDANFDVSGAKDCVAAATPVFEKLRGKLESAYPDCIHEFLPAMFELASMFLEEELNK
jgi:dienelactone hydrolase